MRRTLLIGVFLLALAWAQFRESGLPELAAHLEITTVEGRNGNQVPARLYLYKNDRPFRLTPVDALLPLAPDVFYRDRLWRAVEHPKTLEVTCKGESHLMLLEGRATFDLPAAKYRVEAWRGTFYQPATAELELRAGEQRKLKLELTRLPASEQWLSGDDHIHLTRSRADNDIFLGWIQAEDLNVANFLQLQRQMDAAVQYAFGPAGEARAPGYSIRPGHESRSSYYGHVNILGPTELLRPLSIGLMYANTPEAWPFPFVLFHRARQNYGATVGYAHFDGGASGNLHSTFLMDLALGSIDFTEVFQAGVLRTTDWYRLLNAGFRVTGIAGSDFPVPLGNRAPWPHQMPLLGPERTLVKAVAGESAYESWAAGVRRGAVVVSNGPLLDLTVNGRPIGSVLSWDGDSVTAAGLARAAWHRPIEKLEVILNGRVVAAGATPELPFRLELKESGWLAARVKCAGPEKGPEIWAHTNPIHLHKQGVPTLVKEDRQELARRWEKEVSYYRQAGLVFLEERQRRELFSKMDAALAVLRGSSRPVE